MVGMKKHFILTLARSGSNYLVNLLNRHPNICNYSEVLGEWTLPYKLHQRIGLGGNSPSAYLDYIFRSRFFFFTAQTYSAKSHIRKGLSVNFKKWNTVETVGVKDFSSNLPRRGIENYLHERNDIQVISLYRRNSLKRYISHKKMEGGGTIYVEGNNKEPNTQNLNRIKLDLDALLPELRIFETQLQEHLQLVKSLPSSRTISFCYEDIFSENSKMDLVKDEILDFLGVPAINVESGHKKILSDDIKEIVENYQEVCSFLKGTEFEKYID